MIKSKPVWGRIASGPLGAWIRFIRVIHELRDVRGKVLDVGCGAGEFTKSIKKARSDLEVYAVDNLGKAIAEAKKKPEGIKFSIASAEKLPFKDNFFDAVLCFEVLEHLEKLEQAITEIARVAKPGAVIQITTPLEASLFTVHGWVRKIFGFELRRKLAGHIQQFTHSDVNKLLSKHNIRPTKIYYADHLLRQLTDLVYVPYLLLTNKEFFAVTEKKSKSRGLKRVVLSGLLLVINTAYNLESALFGWFPGLDLHLVAVNKQ